MANFLTIFLQNEEKICPRVRLKPTSRAQHANKPKIPKVIHSPDLDVNPPGPLKLNAWLEIPERSLPVEPGKRSSMAQLVSMMA